MIIGRDILPNVFINNIEVYEKLIKYDIVILDNINNPSWSNKKSLDHKLKLKHCVLTDQLEIDNIKNGISNINTRSEAVEIGLVSRMKRFEPKGVSSLNDKIVYIKTCTYKFSGEYENVSIFANVFLDEVNIEGPIASETAFTSGVISATTNVMYKNNEQYYGPVHFHDGVYMEGKTHKATPHSKIEINSVLNLKVKDLRTKAYKIKKIPKRNPVPLFSNLLVSFDEKTEFNYIFFINIEELIISKTKFGYLYRRLSPAIKERILNDITLSSIRIKRHSVTKDSSRSFEIKNILSGFEGALSPDGIVGSVGTSPGTGFRSTYGQKLEFISHNFGPTIRAVKFHDKTINQGSHGYYKYELEIYFDDQIVPYLEDLLQSLANAITRLEDHSRQLMISRNYDKDVRKLKDEQRTGFFISKNLAERYCLLYNDVKSLIYLLSDTEKNSMLLNNYNLINPISCTIESVSVFTDKMKMIYTKLKSIYGNDRSTIRTNYSNRVGVRSLDTVNRIFVKHKFKNILKPSDSALHYLFEEEKKTDSKLKLTPRKPNSFEEEIKQEPNLKLIPPRPIKFGPVRNRFNFKARQVNPLINRFIKRKFNKKSRSISITPRSLKKPPPEQEKFINVTDILGDETNLNTTTPEEKCEEPFRKPIVAEEIELAVISESQDIKSEMRNFTTKLETLSGFKRNKVGMLIVTQPSWAPYIGEDPTRTLVVKQVAVGDVTMNIDYPYPNKYRLLNNNPIYKLVTNPTTQLESNSLKEASNIYTVVDPMFTQGNIVTNQAEPSMATTTEMAPSTQTTASPSMSTMTVQNNMGGY